jgi:predicted dehydrogenase
MIRANHRKKERSTTMQNSDEKKVDRRSFLEAAGVVAGSALVSTALSYDRILGANDRIALGHIGIGNRGGQLHLMASRLKGKYNVETVAVCDLWKTNRERAAADAGRYYGRAPRALPSPEDLLALKEVDAVLIATPEHSHSPLLKAAVEAGKHAYCEKPMGNVLEEVKAARDAVRQRNLVVQIGTQHRSEPYQLAAREVLRSGVLGEVSKYEIVWNYNGPRWRGRPQVKQIREQDTDWKKWLMTKPYRPFDPQLYFEFRLYKEFSSGIPDQWMSHGIDLVHFYMNEQTPRSIVAHGGVFAWHDGRENPDTFQALVEYPSFLASYSTSFGNDSDSFSRIMGKKATLVNIGGEGSPRWKVVEEKGNHEDNPTIARAERWVTLPGDDKPGPINIGDEELSHLSNWFECLRSGNTRTNATVDNGFRHSVACIMAAQSYWQGKRLYYDAKSEQITDRAPAA